MAKRVLKIISNIVTVFIILIIILSTYSLIEYRRNPDKVPSVFGITGMSVLTGSMRPYLEPGDMIVDKRVKGDEIKVGDIMTYKSSGNIVTHRVVEIVIEDGKHLFRTRGDANNIEDGYLINEEQVVGKVLFKIPYGGYVARFIRSPIGLFVFIIIPVAIMLIGELMKVTLSGGKKEEDKKSEPKDSAHID